MLVSPLGAQACADCPGMMKCETSPRGCVCCKPAARSPRQAVQPKSSCCAKKSTSIVVRAIPIVCSIKGQAPNGQAIVKTCVCCVQSSPNTPMPAVPPTPTSTEIVKAKFFSSPAMLADVAPSASDAHPVRFDQRTPLLEFGSACDRQASLCVWLN